VTKANQEIVVFVTASSEDEAARIGRELIEAGLAACANVLPRIRSVFRWRGKVTEEQEALMILKTRTACFERLTAMVKKYHSYSVPEIIALSVASGSTDYLAWIRQVTPRPRNSGRIGPKNKK
jgi:periplasmic divalent cation tolerance protein